MKTLLTFVGGGERDEVILETALAAARPLSAHLDCLHAHVPALLAARHAHIEFARGAALGNALDQLGANADAFSALAAAHVRTFCASAGVEMCDAPVAGSGVTASFREETSNDPDRLNAQAARSDLIVMGRARQKQGLAPDTLEHLVRHSGRPVLMAATAAPKTLTGTILVCWKDAGSSAAVVAAAAPLLVQARKVVFVSVAKRDQGLAEAVAAVARQAVGDVAEARVIPPGRNGVPEALAAVAEEYSADLVVMGAYGRSRGREILFGSCTDSVLEGNDRPILLLH